MRILLIRHGQDPHEYRGGWSQRKYIYAMRRSVLEDPRVADRPPRDPRAIDAGLAQHPHPAPGRHRIVRRRGLRKLSCSVGMKALATNRTRSAEQR